MERLKFYRHGSRVGATLAGRAVADMQWDEAVELGHVLFRRAYELERDPAHHAVFDVGRRKVLIGGGRVTVLYDGVLAADMEVAAARRVGRALIAVGHQAEEWAKAEAVAADAAVLIRAGMPFGLAAHADVRNEALKVAQHDRDLRRFMANRISDRSVVGTPFVRQGERA